MTNTSPNSLSLNTLTGLGMPILLTLMLVMMVIPLPPVLLDLLFTFNISLSLIVMLVAVYARRPLDFGSFPTVLLLATLLRLALNVASTRVVLLNGNAGPSAAGEVIHSFGDFVIGGNYAVGLVVFIVLVIINFVVVTKGAGRISEVSARFVLDALPGKQMSIDADLGAGIIDAAAARQRRAEISRETDFYGAMDGASKFVRGDAIAGILIVFINIFGGVLIGVLQHDMTFADAAEIYTLLTIGDGLVAQIPSLVLSIAAALIVTRVSDEQDIGAQIVAQLFGGERALMVTAAIVGSMGLVPGMPNIPFLLFAAATGGAAWMVRQRQLHPPKPEPTGKSETAATSEDIGWQHVTPIDAISMEVGYRLIPLVDRDQGGDLMIRIKGVRKKLTQDLGFLIPPVHVRDNLSIAPEEYRIAFMGNIIGQGSVHVNRSMAINPGQVSGVINGISGKDPAFGMAAVWIDPNLREQAQMLGYTVVDPATVIGTHLSQLIMRHAHELISYQDTRELLDQLARSMPKLVEDLTPKLLPLTVIHKVLQNLLREGVTIRDIRTIAECLAEYATRNQDANSLTAAVRIALGRTIVQQISGFDNELGVITLDPGLEQLLMQSVQKDSGEVMAEPALVDKLTTRLSDKSALQSSLGHPTILLASPSLRNWLARLTRYVSHGVHVLSYLEVPEGIKVRVVDSIGHEASLTDGRRMAGARA